MKSIILIHTVKSVLNTFEVKLRDRITQEIKVHNVLDEFLADHPNEVGYFSIENRNRLLMDLKAAELTGADLIVTTCSTLTPTVEMIRPFIKTPIIVIDEAMGKKGITYGNQVLILATAMSTIAPTTKLLRGEGRKAGKEIIVDSMVCQDAFRAMKNQNMKEHDAILREKAGEISGYDCIILAQASMAHLETDIGQICGCPVLSSMNLCIEQINEVLNA